MRASQSVPGLAWPGFHMCEPPELSQKSLFIDGSRSLAEKKMKMASNCPFSICWMAAPCSSASTSTATPTCRRSSRSTAAERSSDVLPRMVRMVKRASVPLSSSSHSSASRFRRPRPASSALAVSTDGG